ncbi:MAG: peptidase M15 [Spirochaetes bacterium]|nr:MAG: peptidase M15 [Spirochaetota bacterium]
MKTTRILSAVLALCLWIPAACGESGQEGDGDAKPRACTRMPEGFSDLALVSGVRTDVRYATANNFTGAAMDGYRAGCAWLVTPAAEALGRVREELAHRGYGLLVLDAYRPLRAQIHMIRWARASGKAWLVGTYISGIANTEAVYGHPCGNTVDLTLTDERGRELDMGSAYDEFSERAWTKNADGPARERREILKSAMERQGFKNYHMEWWHYTYMKPFKARDAVIE